MKSAEEILKEHPVSLSNHGLRVVIQAMREYAAQAITEQLEVAADNVRYTVDWDYVKMVDRESITSCTRIPLP